jgi:hypothetical protein
MKTIQAALLAACCLLLWQKALRADYVELNKRFHRMTSNVTIRKIDKPTLSNLDFTAYIANPVLRDSQQFKPKPPPQSMNPADFSFGGVISEPCFAIESTPLTKEEINGAMAWEPLMKRIWENFKVDKFIKIENAVVEKKWADSSIWAPYQKITVAYVHGVGDSAQLWVKIEFMPWVKFLKGMRDGEGGFKELFGRISLSGIDAQRKSEVFNWIESEYCAKELSKEEIVDWATILASYWYPKYNTDIVDLNGQTIWPSPETEKPVLSELRGLSVSNPLIVMRATPFEEPIYFVLMVDPTIKKFDSLSMQPQPKKQGLRFTSDSLKRDNAQLSKNFIGNNNRFEMEIRENGGYEKWASKDSAWRSEQRNAERALPPDQSAIIGRDGWIFFNKDIECLNSGDLNTQSPEKNPFPHLVALKDYLTKRGISLLFVIVPDKAEVYFDRLPPPQLKDDYSIVNPFFRKFLKNLQDTGIEVIDLLPLFLAAKKEDAAAGEAVYQKQDTHWSFRGMEIAAHAIAQRIKNYQWYEQTIRTPTLYSIKDTTFLRQGDLVDKIPAAKRINYPAVLLKGKQVFLPDKTLFKPSNPEAPILLMGDSFTGVFELVDCKAAGVGSHIAAQTKLPLDIITSWGGGPQVREKMLRTREKFLSYKRVVIYMMVERDLFNYSQGWDPLKAK